MNYVRIIVSMTSNLNGWLFRWWNHLICGAIYGHKWRADGPEYQGMFPCKCKVCGKQKVF